MRVDAKRAAAMVAAVGAMLAVWATAAGAATPAIAVKVLSTRADLVSNGDALVELELPAGVAPGDVTVTAGATDVSSDFAERANGRVQGLVTGLALGKSTIIATGPGVA